MATFDVESPEFVAITRELEMVKKKASSLKYTELQTCLPAQVRFRVSKTPAKTLDVCLQFPKGFPSTMVLVELKTKTLPLKFLDVITSLIESHKQQIMENDSGQLLAVIRLVIDHMEANPLCVCADEIGEIRKMLNVNVDGTRNFLKIRQSKCIVHFNVSSSGYFLEAKIAVPDDYPTSSVTLQVVDSNFPPFFQIYFEAQDHALRTKVRVNPASHSTKPTVALTTGREIARQCVEAPVMKLKPKNKSSQSQQPFEIKPSLLPVASFLIEVVNKYPTESCALCKKRCFPVQPQSDWTYERIQTEFKKDSQKLLDSCSIERVYCSHVYHNECLDEYMKTPPFPKKCPACDQVIYHEKWKCSDKTREERWAHKQAKQRELEEVADFLQ